MKTIILSFLVLSVIIATVLGDECQQGDHKKESCNECTCANGKWACTKKICVTKPRDRRETPTSCTPGASYKKDCNTCVCNKEGTHEACTLRACL